MNPDANRSPSCRSNHPYNNISLRYVPIRYASDRRRSCSTSSFRPSAIRPHGSGKKEAAPWHRSGRQAHLHILANRVSLSGELYKDNWIGKRATEAANSIARERNLVQSKDIGKANREEIKQAMDGVLARMQGFDLAGFSRELGKLGFKVREARASTGKLNGYYVEARSGTEYKASEIGKDYTLAHIEKTQKKLKYNSISRNYGNTLKPKNGGLHL